MSEEALRIPDVGVKEQANIREIKGAVSSMQSELSRLNEELNNADAVHILTETQESIDAFIAKYAAVLDKVSMNEDVKTRVLAKLDKLLK